MALCVGCGRASTPPPRCLPCTNSRKRSRTPAERNPLAGASVAEDTPEPERPPPVRVPHDALSPEILRAVLESFVLREGTEYGERDVELGVKVAQVLRQLERGDAHILFDPASESVDIVVSTGRARRRPAEDAG